MLFFYISTKSYIIVIMVPTTYLFVGKLEKILILFGWKKKKPLSLEKKSTSLVSFHLQHQRVHLYIPGYGASHDAKGPQPPAFSRRIFDPAACENIPRIFLYIP